jgi:uncharacterized repeat protein (TIGR02543 family)
MTETKSTKSKQLRIISLIASTALVLTGSMGAGKAALAADSMTPLITFDGNVLASSVVPEEFGQRIEVDQLALDPRPLQRELSTNRAGYRFSGWSQTPGGPPISTLQSASTTSTRVFLYAVWSTKVSLDVNGAQRGSLTEGSSIDYRFGQTLVLPGAGTIRKKGFSFAGWLNGVDSKSIMSSFRAGSLDNGNPTLYAAWTKTINFKSRGAKGTVPAPITYLEGGERISLPTLAQTSLTRDGYDFMGWSTTRKGKPVKKATSYLPKKKIITLHAVWKKTN